MSIGHSNDELTEINITPLVDVMLVLLIVFMITIPAMMQTLSVNLPQESAQADETTESQARLSLDADGVLQLDGQTIRADALPATLKALSQQTPQPMLRVQADEALAYGKVAHVLSLASQAGLAKISFIFSTPAPASQR